MTNYSTVTSINALPITSAGSLAVPKPALSGAVNPGTAGTSAGSVAIPKPALSGSVVVVNPPQVFPLDILDILVELNINGAWVNITDYVYQRDVPTLTGGRPNEASTISPSDMTLTLNNQDGRFSPRNPAGAYYGYLTRNTQIRLSAPVDAIQDSLGYRFWGEVPAWPPQWDVTGTDVYVQIQAAGIMRRLSQAGASALGSALTRYYTELPVSSAPVAYWPCEDASGATNLASPLTGVRPLTVSGTPTLASDSTYAGSQPIPLLSYSRWSAEITAAAIGSRTSNLILKSGSGNFTAQALKTYVEAWAGGGGGQSGAGSGGSGGEYFYQPLQTTIGQVCKYSVGAGGTGGSSGGDGSGGGNTTFTADGITYTAHAGHGGSGEDGVNGGGGSTAYYHNTGGASRASQQSLDDGGGGGGSSAGNLAAGAEGGAHNGANGGAGGSGVAGAGNGGSGGANTGRTGQPGANGNVPGGGGGSGAWSGTLGNGGNGGDGQLILSWESNAYPAVSANVLRFLLNVPSTGAPNYAVLASIYTNGTVSQMDVVYGSSGSLRIIGYSTSTGVTTTVFDTGAQVFSANGVPLIVTAELQQNGTGATWVIGAIQPGQNTVATLFSGTVASVTVSTVTAVVINPNSTVNDTAIGQITVQYVSTALTDVAFAASGYTGEDAASRFLRLCGENSIPAELTGHTTDAALMGPQTTETLIELLQECESCDLGLLYEPRDQFGLGYRTRVDMCNQTPVAALDYAQAQLASPLAPTDDDLLIVNDVIVQQPSGSSFETTLQTGALSVQAPPAGIGEYQKSYTVNVATVGQLGDIAGWLLALGTVDQQRFPAISIDMTRAEVIAVFGEVQAVGIGDLITIANPPAWMPPELIQQLVVGWTETVNAYQWTITWNCVPARPYFTALVSDPNYGRLNTDGSQLTTAISTTAASMQVATTGDTNSTGVLNGIPVGVYRGPCGVWAQNGVTTGGAQSGITAYGKWLGQPISYVLDYVIDSPNSWAEFTGAYLDDAVTGYTNLNSWGALPAGQTMMLALPACVGKSAGSGGTTWAAEAAGTNDAYWTELGNNLISWGYGNAILRIGREFNGNWYNWAPAVSGDDEAQYIAGYQHVVTLLRGLTGAAFQFMWNPFVSPGTVNGQSGAAAETQNWYPGSAYVDLIGLDCYDWGDYPTQASAPFGNRTLVQQETNWTNIEGQQDGLTSWGSFATAQGKTLSLPEWGLITWLTGGTDYYGGGDDPYYITQMHTAMAEFFMQAMWEDLGSGLFDTDSDPSRTAALPPPDLSRTAFLDLFGPVLPASGSPLWTTAASDFPFDIIINGERVTVTGVTGTTSPQTFTVTRSVNGVVLAHNPGEAISLFYPATLGV